MFQISSLFFSSKIKGASTSLSATSCGVVSLPLAKILFFFFYGSINAESTFRVKSNILSILHVLLRHPWVLQQDDAKLHSAHVTKAWLRKKRSVWLSQVKKCIFNNKINNNSIASSRHAQHQTSSCNSFTSLCLHPFLKTPFVHPHMMFLFLCPSWMCLCGVFKQTTGVPAQHVKFPALSVWPQLFNNKKLYSMRVESRLLSSGIVLYKLLETEYMRKFTAEGGVTCGALLHHFWASDANNSPAIID